MTRKCHAYGKPAETIRLRRSRPSIPALALALMITMLFVYAASLAVQPKPETSDAVADRTGMDVSMPGMDISFIIADRCSDALQARILAAQCSQNGGAGLILADGNEHFIIREAVSNAGQQPSLHRSASGLTLKISGSSAEIAALSSAVDFLRTQAVETGALAASLEAGDTDAASIRSLLEIYRTRARRCLTSLEGIRDASPVPVLLQSCAAACLERLDAAITDTHPGSLRLLHAAACAEWIGLLDELCMER